MARVRASHPAAGPDVHVLPDDLVPEIAVQLDELGEYRAVIDPGSPQQLVDLRWASLHAARLLGRPVKVSTTQAVDSGGAPITARVTFASGKGSTIPQQRRGY